MYNKSVLLLGGTGAIGSECVDILKNMPVNVFVTSRCNHASFNNIYYIQGNALDESFLKNVVTTRKWDVIIDFMIHSIEDFKKIYRLLLENTKHYIFLSSARVYTKPQGGVIRESTPRYIDIKNRNATLTEDTYPVIKARSEDILFSSGYKNFTIIRPGTTYNYNRIDLANLRKEEWLKRVLEGKSIVISEDLLNVRFTNTFGRDVARGIISLFNNNKAMCRAYNITESHSYTWKEILDIYIQVLRKHHIEPKIKIIKKCPLIILKNKNEQYINFMSWNHAFDNSAISSYLDTNKFVDARTGLAECLNKFLENPTPQWKEINWEIEGILDCKAKEHTKLAKIDGIRNKVIYIGYRLDLYPLLHLYNIIKHLLYNKEK